MQRLTLYQIASEHLQNNYNLEPEELQQMMQVSIKSLTESLAAAQQALNRSEMDDLLSAVHKMNGTLLSLGLNVEAGPARQIERDLRANLDKDYRPAVDQLIKNLQPLLSPDKQS